MVRKREKLLMEIELLKKEYKKSTNKKIKKAILTGLVGALFFQEVYRKALIEQIKELKKELRKRR